ncbi:Signal transduction histidine kinase [Thermomonospora echinospora]|uniref:histidine kinase n=1 Tax=Thermomonospora echinospora TaxID=1992 RepID=A0A1H6DTS4_9ACTN|nr:ATP-binding protein [Thermomonospora echinospora]SEG87995.1 Signal transduction histidine kinase [Thermomonospora echinospora]
MKVTMDLPSPASASPPAEESPPPSTRRPRPTGLLAAGGVLALAAAMAALYRRAGWVVPAALALMAVAAVGGWWLILRHNARDARLSAAIGDRDARWRAFHEERMQTVAAALDQLAGRLEAVLQGQQAPPPGETGLEPQLADQLEHVVRLVAAEAERQRTRELNRVDAITGAVVATTQDLMAGALRVQAEAAAMQRRHSADPDVLDTGNKVDHAAAQLQRMAQGLAVLCGRHPGQQWPDLPLVEAVRAAQGRIVAFERVHVVGDPLLGIASVAAEALIHLLAELLANATQSSTPADMVDVRVRGVRDGAVVEIDDCGLGMDPHTLMLQREIASGRRPVGLADLGATPQRGLAVVGEYARRHGFGVELRESMFRGIQAVVWVPGELTVTVDPAAALGDPAPARPPYPDRPGADEHGPVLERGNQAPGDPSARTSGPARPAREELPQRRARRHRSAPSGPGPGLLPHATGAVSRETPDEAAEWAGRYFGATGDLDTGDLDPSDLDTGVGGADADADTDADADSPEHKER